GMTNYGNGGSYSGNGFVTNANFTIGAKSDNSDHFEGAIDEIRMSNQIISADWITTEYRNQQNSSTYITIGSEVDNLNIWVDDSLSRRKDLKIDSSQFTGTSQEKHIILRPGSAGTNINNWGISGGDTYRYEAVDDVISDDGTTYLRHSTNDTTMYEMFYAVGLPSTTPKGTITNVRIYSTARRTGDVQSNDYDHYVRVGGTRYAFGDTSLTSSWNTDYDERTTNPANSQPWTWQDFEDFEFGFRGYLREGASQGYLQVTQVWAVITYEPASIYLRNFPIYLSINDTDLKTDVQTDGDDIRFYDEYGRKLAHEIIEFDQNNNISHAHLTTWVEIPALSTGGDSYISMYYGNSTMGNQEQVSETWEDFLAVYHLEESPDTPIIDSTINGLNLSMSGDLNSGDLVSGQLDSSIDFSGDNDQLYTTQTITLGSFTVSAWINFDSGWGWDTILNIDRNTNDWRQFSINDQDPRFDGAGYSYAFGGPYSPSTWYYVVFTYDANNTEFKVYVDGIQSGSTRYLSIAEITDDFQIGAWGTTDWWDGKLDEVRMATDARSFAWIKAEYANQYDPETFISIGQEIEKVPPIVNSFGVEDLGDGNPTFWANITDSDSSVDSVTLGVNSSNVMMTKNGSGIWIYQLASIMYGDYYTYQIANASDTQGNFFKTPSSSQNITFDFDTILPEVTDWEYYAATKEFRANVSDAWGTIDTVLVNVTFHENIPDTSLLWAVMSLKPFGYLNDTLSIIKGDIKFVVQVNDTYGNSYTSPEKNPTVSNT
ncbi:MAG: DUF2341 domain-containing protein, partial [Candidatus Kariarchaeaceae archaeon]